MNGAEKQAQFKARMRDKGFVQSTEWIPETQKTIFREIAAALRDGKVPPNMVTGNQSPNIVTGNQSPEPEAVTEYYRQSRAKDPKSALDRAVRAYVAAEVEPQIEVEVKKRVAKRQEELARQETDLKRLFQEAMRDQERANDLLKNLDGLMTEDEYRLIRGCLHPDRANEELRAKFGKAFHIFSRLEKSVNRDMPIELRRKNGWS